MCGPPLGGGKRVPMGKHKKHHRHGTHAHDQVLIPPHNQQYNPYQPQQFNQPPLPVFNQSHGLLPLQNPQVSI